MGKLAVITDLHADINHFGEAELTKLLRCYANKRRRVCILLEILPIRSTRHWQSINFFASVGYQRPSIWEIMRWAISKGNR